MLSELRLTFKDFLIFYKYKLTMVDSSAAASNKNSKYGGLSRREFEMRRKMAEKFGRKVNHLEG